PLFCHYSDICFQMSRVLSFFFVCVVPVFPGMFSNPGRSLYFIKRPIPYGMVSSDKLPKNYDFAEVEERWRKSWRDEDHYFDHNSEKPQFVIDTPPPYPTGNFHIGNALNWCYIDFFARYKRM